MAFGATGTRSSAFWLVSSWALGGAKIESFTWNGLLADANENGSFFFSASAVDEGAKTEGCFSGAGAVGAEDSGSGSCAFGGANMDENGFLAGVSENGPAFLSSVSLSFGCSVAAGGVVNENGDAGFDVAAKGVEVAGAAAGEGPCGKPNTFLGVADESLETSSGFVKVDGAEVIAAVGSVAWLASGALGKAKGVVDAPELKDPRPSKGLFAVEAAGLELNGWKTEEVAKPEGGLLDSKAEELLREGATGVSVFWAGLANEKDEEEVKKFVPEGIAGLEVGATVGGVMADDEEKSGLLDGNSVNGPVAAGFDVSV